MSSNLIAPTGIIRFLSEEGIAKALNLSPTTIHNSRSLLQGICREAVELLKDKHVPRSTLATSKPEELVEDRKLGKTARTKAAKRAIRSKPRKALKTAQATTPKQTDTTQRWKMSLKVKGLRDLVHTRIEFSRRATVGEESVLEPVSRQIADSYGSGPFSVSHYKLADSIAQKIEAMAHRQKTRDLFDLATVMGSSSPRPGCRARAKTCWGLGRKLRKSGGFLLARAVLDCSLWIGVGVRSRSGHRSAAWDQNGATRQARFVPAGVFCFQSHLWRAASNSP
jgi:hypothetical protein